MPCFQRPLLITTMILPLYIHTILLKCDNTAKEMAQVRSKKLKAYEILILNNDSFISSFLILIPSFLLFLPDSILNKVEAGGMKAIVGILVFLILKEMLVWAIFAMSSKFGETCARPIGNAGVVIGRIEVFREMFNACHMHIRQHPRKMNCWSCTFFLGGGACFTMKLSALSWGWGSIFDYCQLLLKY